MFYKIRNEDKLYIQEHVGKKNRGIIGSVTTIKEKSMKLNLNDFLHFLHRRKKRPAQPQKTENLFWVAVEYHSII